MNGERTSPRPRLGPIFIAPALLASSRAPPVAGVEVTDAEGRTAAQIADDRMVREGGFGPERSAEGIAGIQAVGLPEVAGQGLTREVLLVREDRLYTLKFALPTPDDPPEVGDALVHLFNTVTTSFTLPPVVAANPAKGTAVVAYEIGRAHV